METEPTRMGGKKPPQVPPVLHLIRARSRTSKVLDLDSASSGPPTPPFRPPVTVPFLWEVAPGKPKLQETEARAPPSAAADTASQPLLAGGGGAATAGSDHDDGARARPVQLKLPPRLQAAATAEYSLSPKTVLQGPYGGGKKLMMRSGSTASCLRKPGLGGALFSWRKATAAAGLKKEGHDHHDPAPWDASCCSPAASSASSSSSYFGDDHGHRRQADGREVPEDGEEVEDGAKRSVRIRRFRRNSSLPSMTTSDLWASIRKSVKRITPWS